MNDPRIVIDISLYNDHVQPDELEGVDAVILKSGSGMQRDPKFEANGTVLAKAGISLMAYYWDDIIRDPAEQAEWALEDIAKVGLPIKVLWADQEQWWSNWNEWHDAIIHRVDWSSISRASSKNISLHNSIFMKTLTSKMSGGLCGVYTSRGFTASWAPETKSWIGYYYLWVAHYGRQPQTWTEMTWAELKELWLPKYKPNIPDGGNVEKLVGHQFTGDRCILPGVYGSASKLACLDVNVFDGAFIDRIKASDATVKGSKLRQGQPDVWPKTKPDAKKGSNFVVNVYALNIREGPGTNYNVRGTLTQNQQVAVTERQGNWAKLASGGWVYAAYLTPVVK